MSSPTRLPSLAAVVLVACVWASPAQALLDPAEITITKATSPEPEVDFDFDMLSDLPGYGSFTINAADSPVTIIYDGNGLFDLTELDAAGWELVDIAVQTNDLNDTSSIDLEAGTVTLDIDDSEIMQITFTNRHVPEPASLAVFGLGAALIAYRRRK